MPRSMTGYGKGEHTADDRRFTAEIRSVNHRYNDVTIKLPRGLAEFEDAVKKLVTAETSRGKTDVYISYESFSKNDAAVKLNIPVAEAIAEQLLALKERFSTPDGVSLEILSRFPEILSFDRASFDREAKDIFFNGITRAVTAALAAFVGMREAEGGALSADIEIKLNNIRTMLDTVAGRAPEVAGAYREKLTARLNDLTAGSGLVIDENRLAAEVLFFADRSCIDEEITRLYSHIKQMSAVLSGTEAAGRKLDFLAQEMNREINTIGSKANDAAISAAVVELKNELEKIREQIQNIE